MCVHNVIERRMYNDIPLMAHSKTGSDYKEIFTHAEPDHGQVIYREKLSY